jgi:hypothetical protein
MNNIHTQWQALCRQFNVPLLAQEPQKEPMPQPVLYQPTAGIDCWCCDFRQLPIEAGTVGAMITDLPWATDWLRHVEEFGEWCAKMLRPNGIMATLYTANNLDRLLAGLGKHLHYVWTLVSPMHGVTLLHKPFVTRSCLLCVVFSNTNTPDIHRSPCDLLPYSWPETTRWHEHQQSLSVVQYLVEHFAKEGDLVCDPCSGGWTTMEACWRTGRRFIGADNRPDCLNVARQRFATFTVPNNNH